jgi:hypothetical protein
MGTMSLGLQIAIRKVADNGDVVEYSYSTRDNGEGRVELRRETGDVVLVRPSPDDADGFLFQRVAAKLRKHWRAGEVPDSTWWAS